MTDLTVVDLFAGLRGWSDPWVFHGHRAFTVDWDEAFDVDLHADIRTLRAADLPGDFRHPDVVLASPPCEKFSVMRIGKNWHRPEGEPGCPCPMPDHGPHAPKTPDAAFAQELVEATLRLIRELEPRWWIVENPVGKLRRLPAVEPLERRTVTYCQVGEVLTKEDGTTFSRMKPTDLWGGFPRSLRLPPMCAQGASCHESAPRGSRRGTQGMGSYAERSKIPRELSLMVLEACLEDLRGPIRPGAELPPATFVPAPVQLGLAL